MGVIKMAISPSGFEEYQKALLQKTVDEIVENLDNKIKELATNQLLDICRITSFETEEPLNKVCEEVCYRYLRNGWAEVAYRIDKVQTETYQWTVKYVFLTNETRKKWIENPDCSNYTSVTTIKNR